MVLIVLECREDLKILLRKVFNSPIHVNAMNPLNILWQVLQSEYMNFLIFFTLFSFISVSSLRKTFGKNIGAVIGLIFSLGAALVGTSSGYLSLDNVYTPILLLLLIICISIFFFATFTIKVGGIRMIVALTAFIFLMPFIAPGRLKDVLMPPIAMENRKRPLHER